MEPFTLKFSRGVEASVYRFEQRLTSAGLIEGYPTRERNDRKLQDLLSVPHTHLVPPTQTPIPYEGRYPFGTPASLPPVESIAYLSGKGWSNPVDYRTHGRVVWFQDEWGTDLDPGLLDHLTQVDWFSFTRDVEI
jgi:hypothetical protein